MSSSYSVAVTTVDWLVDSIEGWLETRPDGERLQRDDLREAISKRYATDDELSAVMSAMTEIGMVTRDDNTWVVNRDGVALSKGYRLGLREGLRFSAEKGRSESTRLIAAVPPSLDE